MKLLKSALENQVAQITSIPEHLDFLSQGSMEENKRYDNYDRVMDIALEMLKTVIESTLYENSILTKLAELVGSLVIINSKIVFGRWTLPWLLCLSFWVLQATFLQIWVSKRRQWGYYQNAHRRYHYNQSLSLQNTAELGRYFQEETRHEYLGTRV